MLPAANRGVGMNFGFPDVCLTPTPAGPVPIPYPNFALNAQAVGFSPVVKVSGVHALNMGSTIPMTFGDDAGVAHPVFKQMGAYIMGNPIVKIDKLPAINLTSLTTGNAANNAMGMVVVPSAVNVVYTYAPAGETGGGRCLTNLETVELGALMMGVFAGEPVGVEMLGDTLGYMRVRVITSDIGRRFFVAFQQLMALGAEALVLDLRDCPGGDIEAMILWAGEFLSQGNEIVRWEDGDGDLSIRRSVQDAVYTLPLAVLIDGGTASAASVFAACMQANGRALLLGKRTHPKGTVQCLMPHDGGGFAALNAAKCFAPGGAPIDGVGVRPDIELGECEGCDWPTAARAIWEKDRFFV